MTHTNEQKPSQQEGDKREWPKKAVETLPEDYTILGWGGEFSTVEENTPGIAWDDVNEEWTTIKKWWMKDKSLVFAALHDSEIVRLNKPYSSSDIHDKVREFEDQTGTEHLLSSDDALRQQYRPLDWLLEYFPNAQLQCAKFSYDNNLKHTGEEGMVWQMEKSVGDGNQLSRHLLEGMHYAKTGNEKEALYHLTAVAWRGLELLERYMTEMEPFNESR